MSDAVIVSAARTPIGRARKGSLVDARPDDLAAFAIDAALKQVPELPREEIVDVMIGCGFPQERQGMNLARRAALLADLPASVPGTTVNRFCASSLQTIRMAFHAGGMAPNTPNMSPEPQPTSTATLSIRSAKAPIVNRTAAPSTSVSANAEATSDAVTLISLTSHVCGVIAASSSASPISVIAPPRRARSTADWTANGRPTHS